MAQAYPKHDEDFYGWTKGQIQLLKKNKIKEIDVNYLIEELESMGASEKRELRSRLAQLIFHLLKYEYQKHLRSRSWKASIDEPRVQIAFVMKDNPSLKSQINEKVAEAYKSSLFLMDKETDIPRQALPATCPYTLEQLQDDEFYPA